MMLTYAIILIATALNERDIQNESPIQAEKPRPQGGERNSGQWKLSHRSIVLIVLLCLGAIKSRL